MRGGKRNPVIIRWCGIADFILGLKIVIIPKTRVWEWGQPGFSSRRRSNLSFKKLIIKYKAYTSLKAHLEEGELLDFASFSQNCQMWLLFDVASLWLCIHPGKNMYTKFWSQLPTQLQHTRRVVFLPHNFSLLMLNVYTWLRPFVGAVLLKCQPHMLQSCLYFWSLTICGFQKWDVIWGKQFHYLLTLGVNCLARFLLHS